MRLRAEWPRAQVRAPSFGARHRIEHHKSNILCICNTFISLKLAELMLVEVSSLETEKRKIRSDSGNSGQLPLKWSKFHQNRARGPKPRFAGLRPAPFYLICILKYLNLNNTFFRYQKFETRKTFSITGNVENITFIIHKHHALNHSLT